MPAITKAELAALFEKAFDDESDVVVSPEQARKRQANKMADAIFSFVIGRETTVTGTSATGGPVTGTGIIKE